MIHPWRYRRFHISQLLAWLALGMLIGLFAGKFFGVGAMWPVLIVASIFVVVSLHSRRWFACCVIVIAGFGVGVLRGSEFLRDVQKLDAYVGKNVVLTGKISQDPVATNGSDVWQTQLSSVVVGREESRGEVYATIVSDEPLRRGDTVTLVGKAQAGFGNFRLSLYRSELRHVVRPNDPFLAARNSFASATRKVTPEPEASLGLGFLVGEKAALPSDLTEQLKTVGLTHIVVASGYNLTILVRFARRFLARRSRYLALVGSGILVAGFVLVSGFSPSMNRAAIVTALTLLAWYYGRKFHPVKLILYVAAASAFVYPAYVWSDMGWLLSFAAFTGVLVIAPIATKLLYKNNTEPGAFVQLVVETISAEIMTLPIIIAAFGYVPLFALLANVLVAPVIPFAMLCTFVAGLAGFAGALLGIFALPAGILVAYVIAVVQWLASPDWARFAFAPPAWCLCVVYCLLLAACVVVWKRRRVDLMGVSVVE